MIKKYKIIKGSIFMNNDKIKIENERLAIILREILGEKNLIN